MKNIYENIGHVIKKKEKFDRNMNMCYAARKQKRLIYVQSY